MLNKIDAHYNIAEGKPLFIYLYVYIFHIIQIHSAKGTFVFRENVLKLYVLFQYPKCII